MNKPQHEKNENKNKNENKIEYSGHYTDQKYRIPFLDGTINMYLKGNTSQIGSTKFSLIYSTPKLVFSLEYNSTKNEMLIGGVHCSYNFDYNIVRGSNSKIKEVIHQLDQHLTGNPSLKDKALKENLRKSFIHLKHNLKYNNKNICEVLSSPKIFIYDTEIKPNLVVLTDRIISLKEHFESVTESPPEYHYLVGFDDNGKEILKSNVSKLEYKILDNNQINFIDQRYSDRNRCPPPIRLSISYESSKLIEQSEFKLLLDNLSKRNN